MANLSEPSSAVVVSVRFGGVVLDRIEAGWSNDDQPGTAMRYLQRWTGSGVTRLSTQTLRDGRSPEDVLVEEVAGELLALSMLADLPKSEMRQILRSVDEFEPRATGSALDVDGTSTAGTIFPALASPIGSVSGAAVRHGRDTIVVIHGGVPYSAISVQTSAVIDAGADRPPHWW